MTVRSCSVSHVRSCFASKRTAGASSFTDATSRHIQSRLSAQSAVSAASSGQRQTDRRHVSVQVKCTTLGGLHNVRANALFCSDDVNRLGVWLVLLVTCARHEATLSTSDRTGGFALVPCQNLRTGFFALVN